MEKNIAERLKHITSESYISYEDISICTVKLLYSLIKGENLQEIIDIASEQLGNPVALLDESYKLLVYTKDVVVDDPIWSAILEEGCVPAHFVNTCQNERVIERIRKSKLPILADYPFLHHKLIMTEIKAGNKIIAHMGISEAQRPFKESDIEIVAMISDVISAEMQKSRLFRNANRIICDHFVTDLLSGKIKNKDIISERAKKVDLHLKKNLYIMTVNIDEYEIQNMTITYTRELLEKIIPGSKSVIYNDQIVLIISRDDHVLLSACEMDDVKKLIRENKMYVGFSRCFHDLSDLREHYLQSVNSIELGIRIKREEIMFFYEDFAMYHLFDISSKKYNLKTFCHPSIFLLEEYDRQNDTDFLQSLYTYLENARNIVISARVLHIHRNTMKYRLDKIKEIINLDLSKKEILFHLHHSLKILKFIKEVELLDL